jgi:hypothetical protein
MDLQAPHAEVQVPPGRVHRAGVEAPAGPVPALRTDQLAAAQRDLHNDPSRLEVHRAHPDPVQAQQARECRREAHVVLPRKPLDLHHQAASLTRRAAPHALGSCARRSVKGAATRLAALGPDGPRLTARPRSADPHPTVAHRAQPRRRSPSPERPLSHRIRSEPHPHRVQETPFSPLNRALQALRHHSAGPASTALDSSALSFSNSRISSPHAPAPANPSPAGLRSQTRHTSQTSALRSGALSILGARPVWMRSTLAVPISLPCDLTARAVARPGRVGSAGVRQRWTDCRARRDS